MTLPFLLATKEGMTQIFTNEGICVPVTVLKIHENQVVEKKTIERDGYAAVVVGYGEIREKLVNMPRKGTFAKNKLENKRFLREFRIEASELDNFEIGKPLSLESFKEVRSLDIAGTSKGKGFAGVMKRWNFSGFRATHGTHEYFRHGGSIGCRVKPGKVFKGKKMPGQMGNERVKVQNIGIARIMEEEGVLCVRGAVPGARGGLLELQASSRKPKGLKGLASGEVQVGLKNPMKASKAAKK